ncbi:unnamed protein product [Cladocopium goreaui]|uniref:Dehydrogenase/reductase SDR family member on chromosome X n=1 Tax=Cladocopium goreaui TaxID=2562237 RepID=A0A9P1G5V6_9DINO|nr:unnamed protein product [Cladocopium goreaui]
MELPLAPAAPAIPAIPAIAASHQKAISRQPGCAATRSSLSPRGAASLSLGLAACLRWRRAARKPQTRRYDVAEPRQMPRRMELSGKTELGERLCIITGGTSRLGSAIARGLAASGRFQRILLVGRDLDRGQEVVKELKEVGVQASFEAVDLADQAQVAQFCQRLGDRAVHSLVLAAGVTALEEREETRDGLEMHFGVNYLSRFNMVSRLMKNLEKGGTPEDPCKILLCGSSRHRGEPQLGFAALGAALPLALGDMEDLQLQAAGAYRPWKAFGQAALCNVMFTYELQKRLPVGGPVAVSCFDPGPMTTCWHLYRQEENRWLSAGMSTFEKEIFSYFTRLVQAPEQAAEAAISLATAETLPGRHAGAPQVGFANYWENGMPSLSKFPLPWNWGNSYDEVIWGELWQHSQQLLKAR